MRTLTFSMAVMCYLATLALGALMLVEASVSQWVSDIASELTVQVSSRSGSDPKAETRKALDILASTPGISQARELSGDDVGKLLEPWLGPAPALDGLPLPTLISVTLDESRPADLVGLEKRLAANVKGVSLDTHLLWQAQFTRAASSLRLLSFAILFLIALSATGLVIFATRAVLDTNRAVIEVLNLVGASDAFIARAVKGRFLRSSFLAGLFGTIGGLATFAAMGLIGGPGDSAIAAASTHLLIAAPSVAAATYAVFLLVPVCATLLSLATAHLAVVRQLRRA